MDQLKAYQRKRITGGWTRVDLLLMLYDRAIAEIESCEIAVEAGDEVAFRKHELSARKTLIAIQAGLKPEECEIAFNILRLLHYVLVTFDQARYDACKKTLAQIRDGFAQIADEANELEKTGAIPSMPVSDSFESLA